MFLANIKTFTAEFSIAETKKIKNDQVMGHLP